MIELLHKNIFAILFAIAIIINFISVHSYKSKVRNLATLVSCIIAIILIFDIYPEEYKQTLVNYNWIWFTITLYNTVNAFLYLKERKQKEQIENSQLYKFHMKSIEDYIIEKQLYKTNSKSFMTQGISKYLNANQKNLGGYINLKNKNTEEAEILSKIYEDNYIEFSIKYLKGIFHLQYSHNGFLLPERIANQLGYLFDSKFDTQLNTSIFSFEKFYKLKNTETLKSPDTNNLSKRIFIIDSINSINSTINNNDVTSLNHIFNTTQSISYFLWVWEWHKKNNEEIFFILKSKASEIIKALNDQTSSSHDSIESLDFSINYFNHNENIKTTLVNYPDKTTDIDIDIFSKKERAYKIKITKSPSYHTFFTSLINNHTIDIDSVLERHKKNNSTLYIN